MLNPFRTTSDLWAETKLRLGHEIEPAIKNWLQAQGYVDSVLAAEEPTSPFELLLRAAREGQALIATFMETAGGTYNGQGREFRSSGRYERSLHDSFVIEEEGEQRDLLGLLIARRVERSEEVTRFRQDVLPDGLLDRYDVVPWVRSHAPEAIPLDPIFMALGFWPNKRVGYELLQAATYYAGLLAFPSRETSVEDRLFRVGGIQSVLGRLVVLAVNISEQVGWAFGETVWFLLTGERPRLPAIRATLTKALSEGGPRIVMEVATEASPTEVRDAYKALRDMINPGQRSKSLDPKTSAFVRFVLQQDDVDPDRPEDWQSLVTEWNELPHVRANSWQIESGERRRISNTYKRALNAIQSFNLEAIFRDMETEYMMDELLTEPEDFGAQPWEIQ